MASDIKSSARQLMARARTATGIDIVDSAIEPPLEQLLKSLSAEAQLTKDGARAFEKRLLRVLSNRLRMERDFRQHPEISDQKIVRPLIMTGAARTGSTKLAKLLSASGDFLYFTCWQGQSMSLISGDRNEDPAQRIRIADEENRYFDEHAPLAKLIHHYSTFEPEEETLIYEHLLFAPFTMTVAFVPGFVQWYMEHRDIDAELVYLTRCLKYFKWQFHDGDPRPFLLKTPIYNGSDVYLIKHFPDAILLTTHRDPVSVISSGVSLQVVFKKGYSDIDLTKILGPVLLEGLATGVDQHLEVREQHPEIGIYDVNYSMLTQNVDHLITEIYAHAGMTLSDQSRKAMLDWNRENAQHKGGMHKHTLADFLLTPERVNRRFEKYIARFGNHF